MYLIHLTSLKNLKNIIKDNELKAPYLTGLINQGNGVYNPSNQKYIFFSCIDNLERDFSNYEVILYFDIKLLYNRTFYINNFRHNPTPEKGNTKYPQYYKKTDKILKKVFNKSLKASEKDFYVFHQISIKNKINLKYLKAIKFKNKSYNLVNKLKDKYDISYFKK